MSIHGRQFYTQNLPKMVVKFEEILQKTEGKEWDCVKILAFDTEGNHNPIMFTCWNKVCFDANKMQKGEFYEVSYEIQSKILKASWQTIITAKRIRKAFVETPVIEETETPEQPVIEEDWKESIERILTEINEKIQIINEKFLII